MKKRRILQRMMAVLFLAVLVTGMVSNAAPISVLAQDANIASDPGWELGADGKLTISSQDGMTDWIKNRNLHKGDVTSVEIQDGVASIENEAFNGCNSLKDITIPASVTSIGSSAFRGCSGLTSITIPEKVTSIGTYAFMDCSSLTSITIPENVTIIDNRAFSGCSSLTSITIPENVTSIKASAFEGCSSLTSIEIPSGVTAIEGSTFWGCSSLTSITIPENVTSIGSSAFRKCSGLTSITIPETVTSIGTYAFRDCSSLTSITIPEKVTSIETSAFEGCSRLTSITIPETVTSIKASAFRDCTSLESIEIPENVTSIEISAFSGCSSLTSITIPETVTSIESYAFEDCSSLTSVTMKSTTPPTIGTNVFGSCKFVTENKKGIHVPEGKAQDYKEAWTNLAVYIADGTIASGTDWVIDVSGKLTIRSDAGMEDWIKNGRDINNESVRTVKIQDGVKSIGNYAFAGCSNLESVEIPSSVKSIGDYAFVDCSNLLSVEIPSSVTSIRGNAFEGCSSLESIELPDSVTEILGPVFRDCSSLKSIKLPSDMTSIESYMFYGCSNLTSIEIPSDVIAIGSSAFEGCSSLTSIEIPSGVQYIQMSAFEGCSSLTSVTMKGTAPPQLQGSEFTDCKFVTEGKKGIHVPEGRVQYYKERWMQWEDYIAGDSESSTGTIKIDTNTWNEFLDSVTFELFFKETKTVTIETGDENSDVDKVYYYISDKALSLAQVQSLEERLWTEGSSFTINQDKQCVIYVKITDKAGNAAYISSNGLVFDSTNPVISGVTDGQTYRTPQTVTVTDDNIKSVKVDGKEVTLNDGKFILGAVSKEQTIVVADKAGNTVTVKVTVKTEKENTEDAKKVVEHVLADYMAANADTKQDIQKKIDEAVRKAGITDVTVTVGELTKTEATGNTAGSIAGSVTIVCGSETDSVAINKTIPATSAGKIDKDVQTDGKAPATQIFTSVKELEDMLLTNEEKQQAADGTDIKVVLDVKDAQESVGSEDKSKVEAALDGCTMGQYLDISLYKLIGENRTDITKTDKTIVITIAVPENLRNPDGNVRRAFRVIRVHEGEVQLLDDMDDSAETITIATDRFSTYAIVYKDAVSGGNSGGNDNSGDEEDEDLNQFQSVSPNTGDGTPLEWYAVCVIIAGALCLFLYTRERRKKIV